MRLPEGSYSFDLRSYNILIDYLVKKSNFTFTDVIGRNIQEIGRVQCWSDVL